MILPFNTFHRKTKWWYTMFKPTIHLHHHLVLLIFHVNDVHLFQMCSETRFSHFFRTIDYLISK